jgi:hypothetical protein
MTKLIFFVFSFIMLTGCTNSNTSGANSLKNDTINVDNSKQIGISEVDSAFKLDFFNAIPDTLSGCGEYFTYDTTPVTKDRYIFLSNLTEFAIIKINGNDIYLKRDSFESKEINDKSYIAVYKGQYYKAILTIKQTKSYDEGGFFSGTLQIIGEKINATFKVHGESGC